MSREHRIKEIVSAVIGVEAGALDGNCGPMNTEAWNSLAHITIVTMIEQEFNVSFSVQEIVAVSGIADLARLIGEKSHG